MREVYKVKPCIPIITKKKRVAAYARVSLDSERLMHSLSAQVSYYSEYIQKNPFWIYIGVYADNFISGTQTEKRDEFNRLMKDCDDGKIDIILVKSISRFARNTVDLLSTVRHLKDIGVEIQFEKENINSMSNDGELMLSILASFAQEESHSISENVKWGTRKRFEKGIPNGKVRVFGYSWEDDNLTIIPNEAEIVRFIFCGFLDGQSPRKIAKFLNNQGITTVSGCQWSDFSIRYVLTNITYTGNMLLQKVFTDDPIIKRRKINRGELPRYFVEETHEAIISNADFDRVQEEFVNRSKCRKSVFSRKIQCGNCGEYYRRNTVGQKESYKVWVCSTKRSNGCKACNAKDFREDKLIEIAIEIFGSFNGKEFVDKIKNIKVENDMLNFNMYNGITISKKYFGKVSRHNGRKNSTDNTGNS